MRETFRWNEQHHRWDVRRSGSWIPSRTMKGLNLDDGVEFLLRARNAGVRVQRMADYKTPTVPLRTS